LRGTDVACVEGEGVAAACRLPAQAALGKPALAVFPRQVEVDVVEALAAACQRLAIGERWTKKCAGGDRVKNRDLM